MSAPILWMLLPMLAGGVLFLMRRWYRLTVSLGTGLALLLALLAWQVPIDTLLRLGAWTFKINASLDVLGRQFTLAEADRPLLTVIYVLAAIWFAVAYVSRAGRIFVPLGLVTTGLLVGVPAVDPFLYAALLLEMVALVCVVILTRPGQPLRRGALRFLIFQTLGMPFILFTGWLLTGVEASPGELALVSRAAVLLGIGFVFWLAIFPFHTWLPMVAEDAHPLSAGFVFFMYSFVVLLFGLGFLERFAWLRSAAQLATLLRLAGALMVLTGGVWIAFQRHLARMFGFGVMIEIGKALLAVSLPGGLPLFFAMLLPRAIALAVWSLALVVLQKIPDQSAARPLDFRNIQGLAHKYPLAASGLILALFSLGGLPLLAGFPVYVSLTRQLSAASPVIAVLSLIGTAGLIAAGLRSLSILFIHPDTQSPRWQLTERGAVIFFLAVGVLALFVVGLFPQAFLPPLAELALRFPHLAPAP